MAVEKNVHGSSPANANNGYGIPPGVHAGHPAEKNREHDHHQQRLKHGPGGAQQRLLVTNFDIAPDQKTQQLAEFPQLGDVDQLPTRGRLDDCYIIFDRRSLGRHDPDG